MGVGLEELQRIGLKLFFADGSVLPPHAVVPIFHRWIQTGAIEDQLLIDVADYEHVVDGPGIVLVAHQGIFSLDGGGGRMGLAYVRRTPSPGALVDRLRAITRTLLVACQLLEDESALAGSVRFRGDELDVFANDRLRSPNTAESLSAFEPAVRELANGLYGDTRSAITPLPDDRRERLGVRVKAAHAVDVHTLLGRLR
jgi:hypothetical protein